MFDFDRFLCEPKACLIAPAGSGKTYTIVECLKRLPGRQLVVTHTHAGVAALREKIRRADIPKSKYELEIPLKKLKLLIKVLRKYHYFE